jgi:hypothetical protein
MVKLTSAAILTAIGDAPAALCGDFLLCRALLTREPRTVAGLLADSGEPADTATPVTAETVAAEGYFCGVSHGGCGFPL